jgi:hypothetical protein
MARLSHVLVKYQRTERRALIAVLDDAVEDGEISQEHADALLLDWDVDHFPEQIPKPVREYVLNNRSLPPFSGSWVHDEDEDVD